MVVDLDAGSGQGHLGGKGLWEILQLSDGLALANLLGIELTQSVPGQTGKADLFLNGGLWLAMTAALSDRTTGEAKLVLTLNQLMTVYTALAGLSLERLVDLCWDLLDLDTTLIFLFQLLSNLDWEGLAGLSGSVAGSQELRLGVDTSLGSTGVTLHLVVQITTKTTKLLFEEVTAVNDGFLSIKLDVHVLGFQDDNLIMSSPDLGPILSTIYLERFLLTSGKTEFVLVNLDLDLFRVSERSHFDFALAKEDFQLLLVAAFLLTDHDSKTLP